MNTKGEKASSIKTNHEPKAKPVISSARWGSRMTQPRLVSFSWGQVTTLPSKR